MRWIRPLTLSLVLVAGPALSHAGDLSTRDVVELARSGLADEVLVALVEVDGGPFDLSPADLLDLKAEGLSDRVLAALVRAGREVALGVAFDDPATHDGISTHGWAPSQDWHTTQYVGVAVPIPVYVPVYQHGRSPARRRGHRTDHDKRFRASAPGLQRGAVTADSIRYAPPGFHPGTVRPRTQAAPASSSSAPAPSTPGIARSTANADQPPPGVARSQRSSRR